jgi:hypothetical protein
VQRLWDALQRVRTERPSGRWLQTDPSGNYHISFRFGGRKSRRVHRPKRVALQANLHRSIRPMQRSGISNSRRVVQPTRVESDRAEFLLGDLCAFSVRQFLAGASAMNRGHERCR